MLLIALTLVHGERRVEISFMCEPTDPLYVILRGALDRTRLSDAGGIWVLRHRGRTLRPELTIADAIPEAEGGTAIELEATFWADGLEPESPFDADEFEDDAAERTVQLEADSEMDLALDEDDSSFEAFSVDAPEPGPGAGTSLRMPALEEEEEDDSAATAEREAITAWDMETVAMPPASAPPRAAPGAPPRAASTARLRASASAAEEPRKVGRHATVRYYSRMNPLRMFPLLVVISEKTILEVAKKAVAQRRSERFQVELGSRIEIEPILPGCYCYPPRANLRIVPGEVEKTFWVVPHVLGTLSGPRVVLHQDGEVLAEIPLEIAVTRQTAAIATSVAGFFLPFGMAILKHLRLDFETQLGDGFGLYTKLLRMALSSLTPEMLAVPLLAGAFAFFLRSRPRRRETFWDISAVGPREQLDLAIQAFRAGDQEKGVALVNSLLGTHPEFLPAWRFCGDWHYELGRFADALTHYDQCLELGTTERKVFERASRSASQVGDYERAFGILRQAEEESSDSALTPVMLYNLGCYAARLSRADEAMAYLRRACDRGYRKADQFRADPDLKPLRSRPDFRDLLAALEA